MKTQILSAILVLSLALALCVTAFAEEEGVKVGVDVSRSENLVIAYEGNGIPYGTFGRYASTGLLMFDANPKFTYILRFYVSDMSEQGDYDSNIELAWSDITGWTPEWFQGPFSLEHSTKGDGWNWGWNEYAFNFELDESQQTIRTIGFWLANMHEGSVYISDIEVYFLKEEVNSDPVLSADAGVFISAGLLEERTFYSDYWIEVPTSLSIPQDDTTNHQITVVPGGQSGSVKLSDGFVLAVYINGSEWAESSNLFALKGQNTKELLYYTIDTASREDFGDYAFAAFRGGTDENDAVTRNLCINMDAWKSVPADLYNGQLYFTVEIKESGDADVYPYGD